MGLEVLKGIVKPFVKANPRSGTKNAASMLNIPYSLNGKGKALLMTGTLLPTAAIVGRDMVNVGKMGDISAGGLSDMTSSVKISNQVKSIQQGKKELKVPYRNHGATGDIVFALHNMR